MTTVTFFCPPTPPYSPPFKFLYLKISLSLSLSLSVSLSLSLFENFFSLKISQRFYCNYEEFKSKSFWVKSTTFLCFNSRGFIKLGTFLFIYNNLYLGVCLFVFFFFGVRFWFIFCRKIRALYVCLYVFWLIGLLGNILFLI